MWNELVASPSDGIPGQTGRFTLNLRTSQVASELDDGIGVRAIMFFVSLPLAITHPHFP
jgi:hypothetical protein